MGIERGNDGLGAKTEHAAVPDEVAGLQEHRCACCVGLFDEAHDPSGFARTRRHACLASAKRRARLDIAETGFGAGRLDAEEHQRAVLGDLSGIAGRCLEGGLIRYKVIGRQHQQGGIGRKRVGPQSGNRDGRSGIAPRGFEQLGALDALEGRQLGDLLTGLELVFAVGHDRGLLAVGQRRAARERALQQAELTAKLHEGLWKGFA